jgi:CCR4-NOT transcription complex subunit 4
MTEVETDPQVCPLCVEEFEATDKTFLPCPCGYKVNTVVYIFTIEIFK